ncbi:Alpha-(1,3)-fucosyltransferase B [Exaiptasia diaphana]|nr:Alpha-(1,3)-fucosyltransferase B [Exaiptasia diaphana]
MNYKVNTGLTNFRKVIFQSTNSSTGEKKDPPKDKVLILYWSTYFGNQVVCDEPTPRSKICNNANLKHCTIPCEITANRSRAANSSVMIIHARDPQFPPIQYSHIPLVLFTWENPVYSPLVSKPEFVSKFNYLMSYRPDLADFFLPTMDTPTVEPKPIPFVNKTGLIAAAFSHCEKARTVYLKELMKHIQVDSYGKCLRNINAGLKERYHGDFKQAKTKLLRNYKFTIVFLNQDCDYFVDDQLTHALNAGTIPVFMGTDKVDELLGGNLKKAIIKVRDFANPKKLAEYLVMFPKSFLTTPQGQGMQFLTHPQYCQLCETIAASRKTGQFKKKGSVKPEYCKPRKVHDWLPNSNHSSY